MQYTKHTESEREIRTFCMWHKEKQNVKFGIICVELLNCKQNDPSVLRVTLWYKEIPSWA